MERDEIFEKVRGVVIEALSLDDDDEVNPESTLFGDLGAESIDMLDIKFQLEQAFGFQIADGEIFPEGVTKNPEYVEGGKVTEKGLAELRERAPHIDVSSMEDDPRIERIREVFTVNALVSFVENKLAAA